MFFDAIEIILPQYDGNIQNLLINLSKQI